MFAYRVLIIALLFLFAQLSSAACERLRISAHPKYPPYQWSEDGKIVGASVDITGAILDELGLAYETVDVGPWKRVLKAAQDGKIDMILSLKDVPERRTFLKFTRNPFFENPVAVFVNRDNSFQFDGWTDLIGKQGNMSVGDRHGEEFDRFSNNFLTIDRVSGLNSNFSMLALGRTEYFITGLYPGRAFIGKTQMSDKIEPLNNRVHFGFVHHGFVKSSPCREWHQAIDMGLKAKLMSGETKSAMEDNLQKWFASNVDANR